MARIFFLIFYTFKTYASYDIENPLGKDGSIFTRLIPMEVSYWLHDFYFSLSSPAANDFLHELSEYFLSINGYGKEDLQ